MSTDRSPLDELMQALGVTPFPNRFINSFGALIKKRANKNRKMTVVLSYVKQQAASALQKKMFHL